MAVEGESSEFVTIESLFDGEVIYADDVPTGAVRQLTADVEAYANAAQDGIDMSVIEAYLADQARTSRAKRFAQGFGKALVYLTGGFGGGYLLAQIHDSEERDRRDGAL
jgi:hypothetical protein